MAKKKAPKFHPTKGSASPKDLAAAISENMTIRPHQSAKQSNALFGQILAGTTEPQQSYAKSHPHSPAALYAGLHDKGKTPKAVATQSYDESLSPPKPEPTSGPKQRDLYHAIVAPVPGTDEAVVHPYARAPLPPLPRQRRRRRAVQALY